MDTTTNAIAKRIAEARERLAALADTLEAVMRERDEKQAVYEMTYRQLKVEEAMCDEQEAKIEAVTKERDALRDLVQAADDIAMNACNDAWNFTMVRLNLGDFHVHARAALASRAIADAR